MKVNYTYQDSFDRNRHGALYDRGSADSWYNRGKEPHWYPTGSYNEPRIEDLDERQIAEYNAGFDDNESDLFARKEW